MSEDLTKKLPEQPDARLEELFRLVQSIGTEVSKLRQDFDARQRDTQPLGETLQLIRADIAQLQEGQNQLQEGQNQLRADVTQLRTDMTQLQTDVTQLRTDVTQLQTVVGQMHLEVGQVKEAQWQVRTELRNLNRQQIVLYEAFVQLKAEYRDFDERVFRLESKENS